MSASLKKPFKKLTESRTVSLVILLLIVLAIPLTVFIAQKQQELRQRATEIPATPPYPVNTASLSLSPSTLSKMPGETISAVLSLAAGASKISGVDVTVSFDKNILEVTSFTPSGVFNNQLINTPDNVGGSLRYSAVDTVNTPPTGSFTVGTINFKAKALGATAVTYQNIQITALGVTTAIQTLGNISANYSVVAATPTLIPPTATPTVNIGVGSTTPSVTLTVAPTATTAPTTTPAPVAGDINGDTSVDILDFNMWRSEFLKINTTLKADLNKDNIIDLLDFNIWRNAFGTSIDATPTSIAATAKKVFITSTAYNGNLGGLAGADAKCQTTANTANLGGTWKAWLTDNTTTAASRLSHNNGPYKLVNGTTVANNWADLTDGTLLAAINITELNQTKSSFGIWTNTNTDGTLMNYTSASCNNWTSTSSTLYGGLGNAASTNSSWTWNSSDSCGSLYPLYCFEQ